jgi:hypothetical protein
MWTNIASIPIVLIDAALMMGCITFIPTAATFQAMAQTNRQYRKNIAGMPSSRGRPWEAIDSRPTRPKSDQGHIPIAVRIKNGDRPSTRTAPSVLRNRFEVQR